MTILSLLDLTILDLLALVGICFVAGMVRGFSGFALSAVVMAASALIIPPIQIIPICWFLEMSASVLMLRGGWAEANRKVAITLAVGSTIILPLALYVNKSLPLESSKLIALCLIVGLATLQLAKVRIPFLATNGGLALSGGLAGVATGFAGVGGMVVALYVLAREMSAREMRASLVLFLFIGSVTSLVTYLLLGVMDHTAIARGLFLAIPTMIGVFIGKLLFVPKWEKYYRPFCLILLIVLAFIGILRVVLG